MRIQVYACAYVDNVDLYTAPGAVPCSYMSAAKTEGDGEIASKSNRIYPSTHKRISQMSLDNDCSIAEVIDRLSKTGSAKKPGKGGK